MRHRPVIPLLMFIIAMILALPAGAQQKPFTRDQVQGMVRDDLGDESGANLLEQRGIDFAPPEDFLQSLKAAGSGSVFRGTLCNCPAVQGAPESIEAKAAGYRPGLSKLTVPALRSSRGTNIALQVFAGCIVWSCWETKRKFRAELPRPT